LNPGCFKKSERMSTNTNTNTYIIGADEGCLSEDAKTLCNGPLKPKTHYVWETYAHTTKLGCKYPNPGIFLTCYRLFLYCRFKFRATNIRGQYTDSEYSEKVRTAGMNEVATN